MSNSRKIHKKRKNLRKSGLRRVGGTRPIITRVVDTKRPIITRVVDTKSNENVIHKIESLTENHDDPENPINPEMPAPPRGSIIISDKLLGNNFPFKIASIHLAGGRYDESWIRTTEFYKAKNIQINQVIEKEPHVISGDYNSNLDYPIKPADGFSFWRGPSRDSTGKALANDITYEMKPDRDNDKIYQFFIGPHEQLNKKGYQTDVESFYNEDKICCTDMLNANKVDWIYYKTGSTTMQQINTTVNIDKLSKDPTGEKYADIYRKLEGGLPSSVKIESWNQLKQLHNKHTGKKNAFKERTGYEFETIIKNAEKIYVKKDGNPDAPQLNREFRSYADATDHRAVYSKFNYNGVNILVVNMNVQFYLLNIEIMKRIFKRLHQLFSDKYVIYICVQESWHSTHNTMEMIIHDGDIKNIIKDDLNYPDQAYINERTKKEELEKKGKKHLISKIEETNEIMNKLIKDGIYGKKVSINYLIKGMYSECGFEMLGEVKCELKEMPSDLNADEKLRLQNLTGNCFLANAIYRNDNANDFIANQALEDSGTLQHIESGLLDDLLGKSSDYDTMYEYRNIFPPGSIDSFLNNNTPPSSLKFDTYRSKTQDDMNIIVAAIQEGKKGGRKSHKKRASHKKPKSRKTRKHKRH